MSSRSELAEVRAPNHGLVGTAHRHRHSGRLAQVEADAAAISPMVAVR